MRRPSTCQCAPIRSTLVQKAFLPRLWAFLRHGCYGSAASSFPAVLPLVSLLPEVRDGGVEPVWCVGVAGGEG